MKYYIIAGERSGDLHAGNLVKALRSEDPAALVKGFGGDYMAANGVNLTVHYREMAFMGFAEVVANLRTISKLSRVCKKDMLSFHPDVVILVDYGGFNTRMAKFARKNGLRVFYYITPKVWAWYQKRALTLKANVDRMFVILPFEKDFYKKFDWNVDYVGNPVLDAIKSFVPSTDFLTKYQFRSGAPLVALLPGSRKQELLTILPLMKELAMQCPEYQFGLATVDNLDESLYQELRDIRNITFIANDTYSLLKHATSAVVTSGTATLETALLNVPQVVVYKTSTISYEIGRRFIRVGYISLVNLIANKRVVTELIQHDANPQRLLQEVKAITENPTRRQEVLNDYAVIYSILDVGSASENAARLMYKYLSDKA
jgi:lipid-A-disaccharide synthase